jgi:hypothetical protein
MHKIPKKIGIILVTIGIYSIAANNLPSRLIIAEAIAVAVSKLKLPPPPPDRGITGNRQGSASRTANPDPTIDIPRSDDKYPKLIALVPEYPDKTNSKLTKVWGLTTKEYPSFWFYLPYSQASIDRIDFVLKEGGRSIVHSSILPPAQPGIIGVNLPTKNPPLTITKLYQWELKLTMKPAPESLSKSALAREEIMVSGWIQRANINSGLQAKIQQINLDLQAIDSKLKLRQGLPEQAIAPRLKQADLYSENGFWYDALASCAELRRDFPQDPTIEQNWQDILTAIDLERLIDRQ